MLPPSQRSSLEIRIWSLPHLVFYISVCPPHWIFVLRHNMYEHSPFAVKTYFSNIPTFVIMSLRSPSKRLSKQICFSIRTYFQKSCRLLKLKMKSLASPSVSLRWVCVSCARARMNVCVYVCACMCV